MKTVEIQGQEFYDGQLVKITWSLDYAENGVLICEGVMDPYKKNLIILLHNNWNRQGMRIPTLDYRGYACSWRMNPEKIGPAFGMNPRSIKPLCTKPRDN